ncbi:hypothetical protein PCANC_27231, partial [Puccinia coronata f. sp. avenae]
MDDTVTRRSCDRPVRQADATFSADHMTPIGTPVGRPGPLLRQSEATLTKRVVVTHPPLQACQRNRLPGIHPTSSYKRAHQKLFMDDPNFQLINQSNRTYRCLICPHSKVLTDVAKHLRRPLHKLNASSGPRNRGPTPPFILGEQAANDES